MLKSLKPGQTRTRGRELKESPKRKRRPGGGRRPKDLGRFTRTIIWHASTCRALMGQIYDGTEVMYPLTKIYDDANLKSKLYRALNHELERYGVEFVSSSRDVVELLNEILDLRFDRELGSFRKHGNYGRDPGRVRHGLIHTRLVDEVAACPGFEVTREIFDSLFWTLITKPRPTEFGVHETIHQLSSMILTPEAAQYIEVFTGMASILNSDRTLPELADGFLDAIREIQSRGSVDALGLLGALYLEVIRTSYQRFGRVIKDAFDYCMGDFMGAHGLTKEAAMLLHWLCSYRIFHDRWDTIPTKRALDAAVASVNSERSYQGRRPLGKARLHVKVISLALSYSKSIF